MSEVRSSPAPVALPDNDDMLSEILLRLPPLPSSLPRASLVCKRWRRLLSDPAFLRRFRAHHQTPPLLGFFYQGETEPVFVPTLDRPDRIPRARFSMPQSTSNCWKFIGCRHGLASFLDLIRQEVVVWEPVTGSQWRIAFPPEMRLGLPSTILNGAVLRGSNGSGSDSSFQFVLVFNNGVDKLGCVCVYESKSGKWGNISSILFSTYIVLRDPGVLIGNALYWCLLKPGGILEFDLDRQSLAIIQEPEDAYFKGISFLWVLRTEDRGLGLAIVSSMSIKLWGRETNLNGVLKWVFRKTIELDKLLSLRQSTKAWQTQIEGFDEDNNVIFLFTDNGVFTIQLESMQFKKFLKMEDSIHAYYPYSSFYTAVGNADGSEILNKARDDRPV